MIPFFSPAEQVAVNQWYEVAFAVPPAALALPFSFRYGDKAFAELVPAWECSTEEAGGVRTLTFRAGDVPVIDYLALKVAEVNEYRLICDLDLSKLGPNIKYDMDNSGSLKGPFDRIAYFLDLRKAGEPAKYVYVSMDPFTGDLAKIGIPTVASQARFQTSVTHMNVLSNVTGIVTGTDLTGGNIEFWPNNYGPPNAATVPNASASLWDFGDQFSDPIDGYGSMQVHNHDAKQTLFAINNWKAGASADLGIGNSEGETRDWTFTKNAATYELKRLRVLVRPKQ